MYTYIYIYIYIYACTYIIYNMLVAENLPPGKVPIWQVSL